MQKGFFYDFSKIMYFLIEKVDFKKGSKLVLLRVAEARDLYHNVAESLSFLEMKEFFQIGAIFVSFGPILKLQNFHNCLQKITKFSKKKTIHRHPHSSA